ncbi:hypothetical protein B0H66DRAFT_347417 [Apodospora peruviana]|uniref:C2H2-type domain-containing protein n=1 Tax=Apodospora peruviana TaxID=516989 RepID=A0AAE0HZ85_9PEZI|nr:hypothetical protein B0H66DRAFT_347417 [Apodospora peruviana]
MYLGQWAPLIGSVLACLGYLYLLAVTRIENPDGWDSGGWIPSLTSRNSTYDKRKDHDRGRTDYQFSEVAHVGVIKPPQRLNLHGGEGPKPMTFCSRKAGALDCPLLTNGPSDSFNTDSSAGNSRSEATDGKTQSDRKRRLGTSSGKEGSRDDDGDDDDGDTPRQPNTKRVSRQVFEKKLLFACPYFKRNPSKYRTQRICCGPGWEAVHRVKEHLYRKHRVFRCKRCCNTFSEPSLLEEHQRLPNPCPLRDLSDGAADLEDGFGEEQEKLLRSRKKKTPNIDEVGKWREMYRILFPRVQDEDIPLPFYSIEAAVITTADQDEHQKELCSEYFQEYERYLVHQMKSGCLLAGRLRQGLEKDLNIVDDGAREKVFELFKNVQLEILADFRHARGLGKTMATSSWKQPMKDKSDDASMGGTQSTSDSPGAGTDDSTNLTDSAVDRHANGVEDFHMTLQDADMVDFFNQLAPALGDGEDLGFLEPSGEVEDAAASTADWWYEWQNDDLIQTWPTRTTERVVDDRTGG